MEFSPEGRLFVAEQAGTLEVHQDGTRLQPDFFRDTPLSVDASGERGLLGLAFDPNYAANHFVYVYYTATSPTIHNRLSRFTANAAGDLALAGSERVLLELDPLSRHQPQRRRHPLRPRRQALRRRGRERRRQQCAVAGQPARQDPPVQRRRHDPHRQPVLRPGDGGQPRDLGARAPQSLHLRLPARDRADVHQRRGAEHLGGDQRRRPRGELRLAGDRGGHQQPELRDAALLLRPQPGAGDRGGGVLQPGDRAVPRRLSRGITSSPTSSAAGSGGSTRRPGRSRTSRPMRATRSTSGSAPTGACTTCLGGPDEVFRVQYTASPGGSQGQGPSIVLQPESRAVPAGGLGHVRRPGLGESAPELPVAEGWGEHRGGDGGVVHDLGEGRRQRGPLPRGGLECLRERHERRRHVDGDRRAAGESPRDPRAGPGRADRPCRAPRSRPPRRTPPPPQPRQLARQRRLARRQALLLRQLEARRRRALRRLSVPGAARPPRLG